VSRKLPYLPPAKDLSGAGGIRPKVDTTKGASRFSKRPRKRRPRGAVQAEKILEMVQGAAVPEAPLSDANIVDGLRFTPEDLREIQRISRNPGRNAIAQVAMLRLRAEYTLRKTDSETTKPVTVVIKDFGAESEAGNAKSDN